MAEDQETPTYLDRVLDIAKTWAIFPCENKRPLEPRDWRQVATKDQDQIRELWTKYPTAQVGVPVGLNTGSFVLDVDMPTGPATLAQLENIHGPLPSTWKVRTKRGGLHIHFKLPEGLVLKNTVNKLGAGLDIRTEGGYVICPPTPGYALHPTAGKSLAPAPDWLLNLLTTPATPEHTPILQSGSTTAYGRKALDLECGALAMSGNGQRNDALNVAALKIGSLVAGGHVDQGEAESSLLLAATRAGLGEAEVRKTMASGFKAGFAQPREASTRSIIVDNVDMGHKSLTALTSLTTLTSDDNALTRDGSPLTRDEVTISSLIDGFLEQASGMFSLQEVCQHLDFNTRDLRQAANASLRRREKRNIIEKAGNRNGTYRRVESECSELDFLSDEGMPADITLPFGLNKLVDTMPGNIILVAGEPNAGKTAFLLNVVRENMHKFEVHYFSSEMGPQELRSRLKMFNQPINSWRFKPWERAENFHDVIRPGEGVINVVDYLDVVEDFFQVGRMLKQIHDKLKGAIAVVALQKNKGTDTGLGGGRSLEKPRLYLALEPGVIRVVKGKNWKDVRVNPNNLQRTFKLVGGCNFMPQTDWHPTPPKPEKQGYSR